MKHINFLLFAFCIMHNTHAQTLNNEAALLFNNVNTKLNVAEKNKIADSLGFKISKDEKHFILDDKSADYPFDVFVYPTDLNKDGAEEIFVLYGNTYTSGNAGASVSVFIADKTGVYKNNLGFPGMLPDALSTNNYGYPDLLISGPGMSFPIWKWNGKVYVYSKSIKDTDYEKLRKINIEDISKAYINSIKNLSIPVKQHKP